MSHALGQGLPGKYNAMLIDGYTLSTSTKITHDRFAMDQRSLHRSLRRCCRKPARQELNEAETAPYMGLTVELPCSPSVQKPISLIRRRNCAAVQNEHEALCGLLRPCRQMHPLPVSCGTVSLQILFGLPRSHSSHTSPPYGRPCRHRPE